MAKEYLTPNVYVEEISTIPPSVASVATAIPAFIGYTEKAGDGDRYLDKPVRINSLLDYETIFGKAHPTEFTVTLDSEGKAIQKIEPQDSRTTPKYLLYYALQLFFQNGGGSCYIVSIGKYNQNQDIKKEDFQKGLNAIATEDEPTLILLTDAVNLSSDSEYHDLGITALEQCNKLKDRFAILDVLDSDKENSNIGQKFRTDIGTKYLKYGAAYYPYLQTSLNYQYTEASVTIANLPGSTPGTSATSNPSGSTPGTSATSNPSGSTPGTSATSNPSGSTPGTSATSNLQSLKISNTALYNAIKKEIDAMQVVMPPSAAVAGVYATVDRERGVWKAPANVSLAGVIAPVVKLTNEDQDNLNVDPTSGKSINAIRSFTGRGTLIWGARTLAGNDNEWRYISVRRLFNLIEESIQKAINFVVFEANNAVTWLKVKTIIETYLESLWRQGAIAGATPKEAYFVSVGLGQTMTAQDILEGRMIVKIGIAAVRPAEFIILQFSHKLQQS